MMSEMKSMPKFNKAQKQAVEHNKGPMMVLAGPGAGKTLVITYRTKTLIEKYGVEPGKILVITFTKAAAEEMKVRFQNIMDGKYVPVRFGTFHAVFFSILKHAYHYTASNIIRESEKKRILLEIVENMELDIEDLNEFIQDMENEISLVKGEMLSLEHYFPMNCAKDIFQKVYTRYNQALQRRKLIDFDDMLVYCYELLTQRPDILKMWQQQFQYILIDEFQDINKVQYDIIRLLARPNNNLFIVGDDDQSIYRFRGAKPEIMLQFEEVYPSAKKVLLDVNYRSTACIVETASMVIAHNKTRFPKNIRTDNERGQEVAIREFEDLKQQNEKIIEKVREYQKQGMPLSQIAVLFRTNMQPRALIGKFMEYNIPFRTRDNIPNIYEHWIAKDMESYLRIAHGSRRRADFLQIMNRPNRYIGRDSLEEDTVAFDVWADYYDKMEQSWIARRIDRLYHDCKMLAGMKPFAAVNYIRKGIGYDDYIKEYADQRGMNEEELLDILEQLTDMTKEFDSFDDWQKQKEKYLKELQRAMEKQRTKGEGVVLSTLHSSKGLEYDVVFLIDVNEKIMPYKKAVLDADLEEERRMFYVGMTRAKKQLYLFSVELLNNHSAEPSRFLKELQET